VGGVGLVNSYAQMPAQQQQRDRETERERDLAPQRGQRDKEFSQLPKETERAERERDLAPRLVQV
jgi:hypothetical protein